VRRRRKEQEEEKTREGVTAYTWEMYETHFPPEHVEIAKRLYEQMEAYVDAHDLPWTPALRSHWLGFKRTTGYYAVGVALRKTKPVRLWIRLPADPSDLKITSPFPMLPDDWEDYSRQWYWTISSADAIPDIAPAIQIALQH
jgi:hypothetical protein